MPTFKEEEHGRGSWSAGDMKTAMVSSLVAKLNVRKAAGGVTLPKNSHEHRISKIRTGSEVQVPQNERNLS
jgi:hypothetical protein